MPIQFSEQDMLKLESIRKSRTEGKQRASKAAFLLDSLSGRSDQTIAQHHHVSRSTVVLCIQKCLEFGLDAALAELSSSQAERERERERERGTRGNCQTMRLPGCSTAPAQKPKELGYSYELWTYRLLTAHVRQHCVAAGHPALRRVEPLQTPQDSAAGRTAALQDSLLRGAAGSRLRNQDGAGVLHVYKEVQIVNEYLQRRTTGGAAEPGIVTISYDEKTRHSSVGGDDTGPAPCARAVFQSFAGLRI